MVWAAAPATESLANNLANLLTFLLLLLLALPATAASSICVKYPTAEVSGTGPLPYNYRVIDRTIHAGGHPLNPTNSFGNSDEQVLAILARLKKQGVVTVIDLENTSGIQTRYAKLLSQSGLKRLHLPLHIAKVPNDREWKEILVALKQPVYIHCKWGADRTGAIIGRYLVEVKGYESGTAYAAVISGGSHAGHKGGLKTGLLYRRLKDFIFFGR